MDRRHWGTQAMATTRPQRSDVRSDVGDLRLATVVVNVADMRRAVEFSTAVLGYRPREATWDPEFMMLEDPAGRGVPLSLQRADDAHLQAVRIHVDLYTHEQERHVLR
jgi:hypothetical protein